MSETASNNEVNFGMIFKTNRQLTLDEYVKHLQTQIRASISEQVRTSESPELFTVERVDQMSEALAHFVVDSTEKYIKGQIEHGSNSADGLEFRDLQKERQAEIQDLFWYNTAETWKK